MTEYDYSPDAYEKYLATQQRIARWVDDTHKYPPANPFVPSDAGSTTGHNHVASPQPQQTYSTYRPTPVRTYSTPSTPQPSDDRRSRTRSKTMHTSSSTHHHHEHKSRHRSSRHTSRSASVTPTTVTGTAQPYAGYTTVYPQTATAYPQNYAMYPQTTTSPATTSPTIVTQSPTQPIILPYNAGYVIVPPAGRRMEVINAGDYMNSKTVKKDEKPFFKKFFEGFTRSPSRQRSKSAHGGSRKLRRRDSY